MELYIYALYSQSSYTVNASYPDSGLQLVVSSDTSDTLPPQTELLPHTGTVRKAVS